jgi:AcrR family transcriptional regulator
MGYDDRKRQEKEIKRQDIINAAERVFFTKGYENSSMDTVAKEAEFSKRTVYVYFNSKEQIYYEIMIRGYRMLICMLENCFNKGIPQTAEEELHCIFFTLYSFSINHANYFKAIMEYETKDSSEQTGIDDASKTECYRLGEQVFGYLSNALEKGIKNQTLESGLDGHKTALFLWAYTVGVFNAVAKKSGYLEDFHHISVEEFVTEAFHLAMTLIIKKE